MAGVRGREVDWWANRIDCRHALEAAVPRRLSTAIALIVLLVSSRATPAERHAIGAPSSAGAPAGAPVQSRLEITRPGVYENLIIDGGGVSGNLVKITADDVTLRNCEIRHGSGNGIGIFGQRVVIENCRIHHMLAGSFREQRDAHGISGRWGDAVIRGCDIGYTSGDSIQFDPDRRSAGTVVIERCTLWTGPLPESSGEFLAGERPGENGVDTKTPSEGPRCRLVIRECLFHGWNQPAQISNMAALNLKENVDAEVTQCVFHDNEIALRVRGPGPRGGARVEIIDSAIFGAAVGIRAEDRIERLQISRLAWGPDVAERLRFVNGRPTSGFEQTGDRTAPPLDTLLRDGFR